MKKTTLWSFLTAATLLLSSCYKDKTSPPGGCETTISYSVDIKPIINSSCITNLGPGTGCHDAWILAYSGVVAAIENGTLENECFVELTMPQIPNDFGIDSLTADEKKTLKCWLIQGYPDN